MNQQTDNPGKGCVNGLLLSIPLWAIIGGILYVATHPQKLLVPVTIGGLALMALLVVYACALQIRHDQQTRELEQLQAQAAKDAPVNERLAKLEAK